MPIARFQFPDGRIGRFEIPEGTSPEQAQLFIEQELSGEQPIESAQQSEETGFLGRAKDIFPAMAKGAVGLGEAFVNRLSEIERNAVVSQEQALKNRGILAPAVSEELMQIGVTPEVRDRFKKTQEELQALKSPETQAAEAAARQQSQEGEGFVDTVKAYLSNPSAIYTGVGESIPGMIGGAGIGRSLMAAGMKSPYIAAGAGEGVISSAMTAQGISDEQEGKELTAKQSAITLGSGVLTAGLGALGGKVAKYFGVEDFDKLLVAGASRGTSSNVKSRLVNAFKGALTESTFEELPQSMQEQIAQNIATGKPFDEGVAQAGATGFITALPVGGIGGFVTKTGKATPATEEQVSPEQVSPEQLSQVDQEIPVTDSTETDNPLLQSMQENIEGKKRTRTRKAKVDESIVDEVATPETEAVSEEVTQQYTPEQLAELDTRRIAKQEYEAEQQANLEEFTAQEPERAVAMQEAEVARVDNIYPVKQFKGPAASKEVIKDYNSSRKISDKEGELITLPAWNSLNKIERDLYTYIDQTKGKEAALKSIAGFRTGTKETGLDSSAFVYEANRETAQKEHDIKLPAWQQLPQNTREEFTTSLPKPVKGVISGTGIHNAFGNVATRLEEQNIAYRGMPPSAVTEAQTKLQERGSLKQIEKERNLEQAIDNRQTWDQVLSQSATDVPGAIASTLEEPVMGAAAPKVTSGAVANKLLNTIKNVDGDVDIEFGTLPQGTAGQYNPDTNTITIDKNNLYQEQDGQPVFSRSLSEVVNHEVAHYALDHIADNLNKASPAQKKAMKQLQDIYNVVVNVPIGQNQTVGGEFNIGTFKEFLAEALSNAAFQRTLAGIRVVKPSDKTRWKELSQPERKLFDMIKDSSNVFSAFIKRVTTALGFLPNQAPVLEKVLSNIENVLEDKAYQTPSPEMRGREVSPAQVKKDEKSIQTTEQAIKDASVKLKPKRTKHQIIFGMFTKEARDFAEKKFQNSRAAIKRWQIDMERANKIQIGTPEFNNVYDMIVTSFGRADFLLKEYVDADILKVQQNIDALVEASGSDLDYTLSKLDVYEKALHEPERRAVKYIFNVPLSTSKSLKHDGKKISPADLREVIVDELSKGVTKNEAVQYRKYLDWIVKNYADAAGVSPANYKTTDINASTYNVIAGLTQQDIQQRISDLNKDPLKDLITEAIKNLKSIRKSTIELNKKAGFWSDQVDGIVDFYGFENYVTFKGNPKSQSTTNVANLEISGPRLSNDLKPIEGKFAGRESDSENTALQTLREATIAATRAGRRGLTESIKNAVNQKLIPGKVVKSYSFEERYKGLVNENDFVSRNRILHYNDNGSIDVIEITNEKLLEAIRRTYEESHPILDLVNSWTSFIGQTHTRYNPSFPLLNFVRDVLTNAFVLAIDFTPMEAASYLGNVVTNTVPNMANLFKLSAMYNKGNIKGIRNLAKKNKNAANVLEYLEQGGQISYVQGLTVQGQLDQLHTDLNRSKILRTKEEIDSFFDIWVNAFELGLRSAAYSAAKSSLMNRGMTEEAARIKATSYAKGLANFEEVGEWGKGMGALFMFFRPSATGAVRAMQAFGPALRDFEVVKAELPEAIKNDPEALKTYETNYMRQKAAAQKVSAALIGMGMATYVISGMLSGADDDDRNKAFTDDMERWTRYARFHIFDNDKPIQIPWGFGLGGFLAVGAQIAAMTNNPTFSVLDAAGNMANIALDSFLPLPISRMSPVDHPEAWIIDSVTPSLMKPFVEHAMNINGLGQHIYNSRSRVGDAYIGGDNIPDAYKDATAFLADITDGDIIISPNSLYFFANSYLDGMSRIVHNGYGAGLMLAGEKEFDVKHDVPLIDSFIGSRTDIDAREFNKTRSYVENAEKKINMFKVNPEKFVDYITKRPMDVPIVETFNSEKAKGLKDLEEQAKFIRVNRAMSPKEKTELLKENKLLQNMVKRNITNNIEMLKEFYED